MKTGYAALHKARQHARFFVMQVMRVLACREKRTIGKVNILEIISDNLHISETGIGNLHISEIY